MNKLKFIQVMLIVLFAVPFFALGQESQNVKLEISLIDTTIWKYLRAKDRSKWEISAEDSISAIRDFFQGIQLFKQAQNIFNSKMPEQQKNAKALELFEQAEENFENALQKNPFTKNLKAYIRAACKYLEVLYSRNREDVKLFETCMKRLVFEQDRAELYKIYYYLSSLYVGHQQYEQAIANADKGIDYIFAVEDFADVDTTYLSLLLYFKGYSYYQLNNSDRAIDALEKAKTITDDVNRRRNIAALLRSLYWDDGNIKSLQIYSEANKLESEKKYQQAAQRYQELLETATTNRIRRLAQYKLGDLEFRYLDKKEDGIIRFWIQKNILNALQDSSAEMDSTRNLFLSRYAQMCYQIAASALKSDRKKAFFYFYELTTFENMYRPRAYYRLANLTQNNLDLCLNYCNKAYSSWDIFNKAEQRYLSSLLYIAHRDRGELDEAVAWFRKYRELDEEIKRESSSGKNSNGK